MNKKICPREQKRKSLKGEKIVEHDSVQRTSNATRQNLRHDTSKMKVHDWAADKLQLPAARLTNRNLDKVSRLVSVYCKVKFDARTFVANHWNEVNSKEKKENISLTHCRIHPLHRNAFKSHRVGDRGPEEDISEERKNWTKRPSKKQRMLSINVSSLSNNTTFGEACLETITIPNTVEYSTSVSSNSHPKPISETSGHSDPAVRHKSPISGSQPHRSVDAEPIPGCSKDPDPQLCSKHGKRPLVRNWSILSKSTVSFYELPPLPRITRIPDLRPELPDMSDDPSTRVISMPVYLPVDDDDLTKVKIDDDLLELALVIYLATRRQSKTLFQLINS